MATTTRAKTFITYITATVRLQMFYGPTYRVIRKGLSGFKQLVIHNTLQTAVYVFFYLTEQHSQFVTYLTAALYVHPL